MSRSSGTNSFLRGSVVVASLTMLSRILGFARDLLMARLLGAGMFADAFVVAFRIPNLLRSIFAEGAFTAGFVPSFTEERVKGVKAAQTALREVFTALLLSASVVVAIGMLCAGSITYLFAPGFIEEPEKFRLVTTLTQVMLPYVICVSIVAMANGALNAFEVYGVSPIGQIVVNIVMVLGVIVASYYDSGYSSTLVLSISVLVGGILQVLTLVPFLKRCQLSLGLVAKPFTPVVRQTLVLMVPAVVGGAIYQIIIFSNTLLASLLPDGSVSWLYYADRLIQLPIGVFTMALASVLLPSLSLACAKGDSQRFEDDLSSALRYTAFLIVPLAGMLWLFAEEMMTLLFMRGKFDQRAVHMSALAVQAYAFGIWFTSSYSMVVRGLLAQKKHHIPTLVGIVTLCSNLCLSLLLMGPVPAQGLGGALRWLQSWLPQGLALGHVGLALASALTSGISLVVILGLFLKDNPSFSLGKVLASSLRAHIALGASVLVVSMLRAGQLLGDMLLIQLSVGLCVFLLTYLVVSYLIGAMEVREMWGCVIRVQQRLFRIK